MRTRRAIRFDTKRTRSTAQPSGYERLTEPEIGRRLDEADRIACGLGRGTKLPDAPEGIALSGMRGKIGLTMLEDGSWGAAYGQALNTWIAKVGDNPRLPGEAGIEAICQRAFAVLGSDSAETASQVFDGVQTVLSRRSDPTAPGWRLCELPRYVPPDDIERVFASRSPPSTRLSESASRNASRCAGQSGVRT